MSVCNVLIHSDIPVVIHDGVVRLRSDIGEKGTRGRKAEARWLARRMLRELAHERALMRAQHS